MIVSTVRYSRWLWLHNSYKTVLHLFLEVVRHYLSTKSLIFGNTKTTNTQICYCRGSSRNCGERELSHILQAWAFYMPGNEKQIPLHLKNSLPSAPEQCDASWDNHAASLRTSQLQWGVEIKNVLKRANLSTHALKGGHSSPSSIKNCHTEHGFIPQRNHCLLLFLLCKGI